MHRSPAVFPKLAHARIADALPLVDRPPLGVLDEKGLRIAAFDLVGTRSLSPRYPLYT